MAKNSLLRVRIDWEKDSGVAAFANHLIASFDGSVYTLRFYQVLPPALIDGGELTNIESVSGRHVTTMVVAKETLPAIVSVLKEMVEQQNDTENELAGK